MKNQSKLLIIVLLLCLPTLSGCGFIVQPKLITSDDIKDASIFDPNTYNLSVTQDSNGCQVTVDCNNLPVIYQEGTVQIKYAPFTTQAVVKCHIGQNTYPILFDTGNGVLAHIATTHINENQLPIFPLNSKQTDNQALNYGLAMIDELRVGNMTFKNLLAVYEPYQTGYHLFGLNGINVGHDNEINMPLTVMQRFKYIAFDHKKKSVGFSLNNSFMAENLKKWKAYPMHIKDQRLYIQSTLEGVDVKLMIDTGSGADLLLTNNCFEKLTEQQPKLKKAWNRKKSGFAPLAGGAFNYQAYLTGGLTFDQHKHRLHTIIYVVKDGKIYNLLTENQFDGMIGFPFFDNTIVVLDFEHQTMWAKKEKWSRFEN